MPVTLSRYLYSSPISWSHLTIHIPCSTTGPYALNISLYNIPSLYISISFTAHVHNVIHNIFCLNIQMFKHCTECSRKFKIRRTVVTFNSKWTARRLVFKLAIGFLLQKRKKKKERVVLEETLKDVERVCNCGDSKLIWEKFLLNGWFYDAVYNIKLDPVLTYVTDEWK